MTTTGPSMTARKALAPGEDPRLVSFRLRVNDQNPGHTRVTVFAGTREGSRGNTGELALRTPDEWPAFRARIEGFDALLVAARHVVVHIDRSRRMDLDEDCCAERLTDLRAAIEEATP